MLAGDVESLCRMTNLKDLAPENRPLPAVDSEARAIVDKFEELFSEAAPPSTPSAPKAGRDEFAIEFPDDDPLATHTSVRPPRVRGEPRERLLAPASARAPQRHQDAPWPEPFELPRAAATGSREGVAASGEQAPMSAFPGSVDGRRKSSAIFAGIAVALVIGIGAGYLAGKGSDTTANAVKGGPSAIIGPTLRFDYDLTRPPTSGKRRDPVR